jgi:hypothetical protein
VAQWRIEVLGQVRASCGERVVDRFPTQRTAALLAYLALFPRVANIHILRLGGTIRPLESVEAFHKLEFGLFGYYYRKANSQELISDSRAILNNADIGKEVDFLVRWRIFSDFGFSLNYGVFFPGKAYQERGARTFVSAGITYSF